MSIQIMKQIHGNEKYRISINLYGHYHEGGFQNGTRYFKFYYKQWNLIICRNTTQLKPNKPNLTVHLALSLTIYLYLVFLY